MTRLSGARGSVRLRITVAVVVVFGLALAGASWVLVNRVQEALVDGVHSADRVALEQLRADVESGRALPSRLSPPSVARAPGVQAVDSSGNVVAATPGFGDQALVPPAGHRDSHRGRTSSDDATGSARPEDFVLTTVEATGPAGTVNLVAASPVTDVRRSVETVSRALWIAIPSLVVVIGVVVWFLIGRALRPVELITRRVEDISGSNLHERVPEPRSTDEVAYLASTMNAMLDRLEGSANRQRAFVSDASHELRSPVAAIRTELEVALLHPEATSWESVGRSVLAEDERLESIVGDLLTLARLDERPEGRPMSDVDFDAVVAAEARRARRVAIDTAGVGPARVRGRVDELERLVGHLLDNAARHARSRVVVRLETVPGAVTLRVDDDGPGIPEPERTSVFERFGRLTEARTRDAGGAGLGLAVVKRITESHGGSVIVADGPLGGARFEVSLPTP